MARRVRSRWRNRIVVLLLVGGVASLYFGDIWPFDRTASPEDDAQETPMTRLAGDATANLASSDSIPARTSSDSKEPTRLPAPSGNEVKASAEEIAAGMSAWQSGELIRARELLSEAYRSGLPDGEAQSVRKALLDIGQRTVFSPARIEGDPLIEHHVLQPGEVLGKLARQYHVTADLIAHVNGIQNKNWVRAGANLKIPRGPFNAVVYKDQHLCEVFLQDVLVAEFAVGLGEHGSTPTGEWTVSNKLENPTYYPPASRGGKIIPGDDPENPLGEHWIGLAGISGAAVGQIGYGIHGTIEPESIGKNVSLGCVRLHNEDVARLYSMLVEQQSHVVIQ